MPSPVHNLRALPDWSAVPSDSEEDRKLVGRRIAYFGAVFFALSGAFYVYNALVVALLRGGFPPLGRPTFVLHLAATLSCGAQWLLCRSGRRSSRTLNVIDIGGVLVPLGFFAWMAVCDAADFESGVSVQSAKSESLLIAMIALAMLTMRAIIVPGTARRTFWVSTIAVSISPVVSYGIVARAYPASVLASQPWVGLLVPTYVGMWAVLTVVISTIASRIIYGLAQRVREAHEIGQYTLEEKIGEGGMGVVYRARHALLRRPTAVKLLPSDRAGPEGVRRFEREVQLTSSLTHPNTIAIFDFGHTPDGVFYYAMEYLDGITLEELVADQGSLPPARVVHLLKQVAGALHEAHSIGLIHRDIKPANLMLCVRGGIPDQIKVLDFGLVKDFTTEDASLSTANAIVGTPTYISPEAIADPAHIDGRSDLYAVGAVGYYLLTGGNVFTGQTVLELCAQHLHSQPPPPSLRSERPVPASLDALILACLAKDPGLRPASARALVEALSTLDGLDVWTHADAAAWWGEHAERVKSRMGSRRASNRASGPRTVAIDLARRDVAERSPVTAIPPHSRSPNTGVRRM